ncbi:hypothetical protein BURC_02002 [Burkholderiaceae bacterium]|nr:hypothetical protein BURC_02002 [Burkholderiaceae bacterium]
MVYRLLADAVLLAHLLFIAFALFGALALWRWPRLVWLHLPALAWAAYVVIAGDICPLTPLENRLRLAGGEAAYGPSFIEHYLLPLIYPAAVQGEAGRGLQALLGLALLLVNAVTYAWILRRRRAR